MKIIYQIFISIFVFLNQNLYAISSIQEGALIRDAEIEEVLKSYLNPIFEVAGLNPNSLVLYVVNSKEVNAFAMGGGRIGVNTALILKANSASQVIGVFAHETAHLAGNHVIRGIDEYEKALVKGLIGVLGGIAVGLANPEAGAAVLMGAQDVAARSFLKFRRDQEGAADQGAARYLDALGWSSKGMLEFMQMLHKDDFYMNQHVDPYVLTHPLTSERVDFFKSHLTTSPYGASLLPEDFDSNFKRIQVKIAAFTEPPIKTLTRLKPSDTSLLARYGRSIAYLQSGQEEDALREINSLLKEYPQDAFFWDLKGQILFDSGNMPEAINAYSKAVQIKPDIALLRINYAHALTESPNSQDHKKAYHELLRAKTEEPDNPFTYRLLAIYYGKTGNTGLAALSLAEMSFQVEDFDEAKKQAERSLHFLKNDKENQLRAKEILREIKAARNE